MGFWHIYLGLYGGGGLVNTRPNVKRPTAVQVLSGSTDIELLTVSTAVQILTGNTDIELVD